MQEIGLDEDVECDKHVCHGLYKLFTHAHIS